MIMHLFVFKEMYISIHKQKTSKGKLINILVVTSWW